MIVKSKQSSDDKVKTLKVQQKAVAKIQNATITESIIFGIASSLEINEFVDLSQSLLNFHWKWKPNLLKNLEGMELIQNKRFSMN